MTARFVGWIPNVAGRLSFSHIGQTRYPARCRTFNEDDQQHRWIVCEQRRVLSDALVAARYFSFVYGYDPAWRFVLLARSQLIGSDRRAKLVGEIFIFNTARWCQTADEFRSGKHLSDLAMQVAETSISQARTTPPPSDPATTCLEKRETLVGSSDFPSDFRDLANEMRERAVYSVACEIDRSGIVHLEESGRASSVQFTPSVTIKPREMDDNSRRYLCNQAYFFLKDISHVHRHHHRKADTITAAHPDDQQGSWIRETQYSIHRRVVALRRSSSALTLYDALGLMAYMKSFKEIVDDLPESSGKEIALTYNLKETEDSIRAQLESARWNRVQMNLILTALPTLIIALASLLKPGIGDNDIASKSTLFEIIRVSLVDIFSPDWRGVTATFLLLASVPFVYGALDITRLAPVYTAKRVWVVWSPRRQAITWSLAAATAAIATIFAATAAFMGRVNVDLVWALTLGATATVVVGFVLIPYILTLPDLYRTLRMYPERVDLSEPG